ncbi:TniQ protein [Paraburkholderia sp. BL18I3N2]|uniref:TniQ family protein n=1 Tax=Paraburkholderia sp. BL18I3N2 TaxID=1938799 RepID=UPI000D0566AD|nr:TniQ family protein [Paraburkholderia sp. BL18I3N2]PRX20716.1 TniQ protein [Paraburkholderia sp. BL18I3N2]
MIHTDTLFVVPPRAPFKAEPRGLGTWQRQRLSSYLLDVAAAARVRPQAILDSYVDWRAHKRTGRFGKCMRLDLINGSGPSARLWVSAVSPLVGREDLDDLTLLPLAHAFGETPGVMSKRRRWCPQCLYGDVAEGGYPYERLLWSISYVPVCPLHLTRLETACPKCGISQLSELSRHTQSGFCGACKSWLGRKQSEPNAVDSQTALGAYEIWVARDFANLLALDRESAALLSRDRAVGLLPGVIATAYRGNRMELCRHARFPKITVDVWLQGRSLPTLSALVRLSWVLQMPLRSLLAGDKDVAATTPRSEVSVEFLPSKSRRKPLRGCDWARIERNLKGSIDSDQPYESWHAAAQAQGIRPSLLRARFPDLAARIRDAGLQRRREAADARQRARALAFEEATVQCMQELISRQIYPDQLKVRQALRELGFCIDWFAATKVFASVRSRLAGELSTLGRRAAVHGRGTNRNGNAR